MDRIIDRFGHHAPIREAMLARDDLSMAMRQALLSKLSQTLAGFVTARTPARKRPSRSRPTRHTKMWGLWSGTCAKAVS